MLQDELDIFIAYSRLDEKYVANLSELLERVGFTTWRDRKIRYGRPWRKDIHEHLLKAKVVLVCWTASSVDSDWVIYEAAVGSMRMREAADGSSVRDRVVHCMLEKCAIPDPFYGVQAISMVECNGTEFGPGVKELLLELEDHGLKRNNGVPRGWNAWPKRFVSLKQRAFLLVAYSLAMSLLVALVYGYRRLEGGADKTLAAIERTQTQLDTATASFADTVVRLDNKMKEVSGPLEAAMDDVVGIRSGVRGVYGGLEHLHEDVWAIDQSISRLVSWNTWVAGKSLDESIALAESMAGNAKEDADQWKSVVENRREVEDAFGDLRRRLAVVATASVVARIADERMSNIVRSCAISSTIACGASAYDGCLRAITSTRGRALCL